MGFNGWMVVNDEFERHKGGGHYLPSGAIPVFIYRV